MNIISDSLDEGYFYHIYNRGINGCSIFENENNYVFFLEKFNKYLSEFVDVYAYCLLKNHFHLLIKVKSVDLTFTKGQNFDKGLHSENSIVSKQFAKFISSYSQAYNKQNQRHGALLESPFKRKRIQTEDYLKNVIIYIHLNPKEAGLKYESYKFSSYYGIISNFKTKLAKTETIELFDDLENFIFTHKNQPKFDFNF